jgi:hypothetical protein
MADYLLQKRYLNHFGIDLKSTDIVRPEQFASDMKNAQYTKEGAIEKRKGYKAHAANQGGFGLTTYNRISTTDGTASTEMLAIGQNVFRFKKTTMTVTYIGASASATISIFFDTATDQYRCQVVEGTTTLVDEALGLGYDTGSPYTVASLVSVIDALANFTCTATGDTSTPAAFLKILRDWDLSSSGSAAAIVAGYWEQINSTTTNPLAGSNTNRNMTGWENVATTQINNCVYFANGYDNVLKYDGQTLYRAGLPNVDSVSAALGGAGAITGSNYLYQVRYTQFDAAGNLIEGNLFPTTNLLSPAAQSIDVTVANIQAGTGFNTNCAVVNGAQVGVNTITVDAFHTMKVGDTAYFLDGASSAYVTRTVTAIGGTTITVSGAVVNVADNAVISNNLRIGIYRSKTSGSTPTIWYLSAEIPNNSFTATQVYNDNLADASLGIQLIEPVTDRSPPPKGKYISVFRNQTIIGGNITYPNTVFYSDIDGPEYFPDGINSFDVDSPIGDQITGLAPTNEAFAIFKDKSIQIMSGDLANSNFRVDQLTSDLGCIAHASIQEVRGQLMFLSDRGVYSMVGGQLPQPVGQKIEPVFDINASLSTTQLLKLKRAIGFNDRDNERYILYLPAESTTSSNVHPNSNSVLYVYDYHREAWLKWTNINMAGGMTLYENALHFSERRYSAFAGAVVSYLYRVHNLNDAYDYQDDSAYIDFEYSSTWEALNEPSVLKRFLRIRIFSLEELVNNDLFLDVRTEINYIKDATHAQFDFQFTGGGYGVASYDDTTPYGDPAEAVGKHRLGQGRVRSMRVRFLNQREQENVNITGWELEIATPFRPGFKQ